MIPASRTIYTAIPTVSGEWGFRTPTRRSVGYSSEYKATIAAVEAEKEDRAEAKTGSGPVAAVLRKFFASENQPAVSG